MSVMRESIEADWEKSYDPQPEKTYALQYWSGAWANLHVGFTDRLEAVRDMERRFHAEGGQWRIVERVVTEQVIDSAGDADHVAWIGSQSR